MLGRGRHRTSASTLGWRFDLLWFGQAISELGNYVAYLTIPLFVLEVSERNLDFAITYSLETAPTMLVGFVGGVLLDRMRLRPVMIGADLARAGSFLYLAWVAATTTDITQATALASVFVVAFLVGSLSAAFASALFALLPSIVEPKKLAMANGRIAAAQQVMLIVGPLVAGVLVAAFGHSWAFILNASTFMVSAVTLARLGPVGRSERSGERAGLWSEAMHGLRYLWTEIRLRISTGAAAVANFAMGFLEATFVVAAGQVGAHEQWQIGLLFAALGLGGAAGASVAPFASRLIGLGKTMTLGMATFGLAFVFGLQARPFGPLTLALFFVSFFGLSFVNVPLATIRQTYTPELMLGRVIAASRAIGWATLPIGSLVGAFIADRAGYMLVATVTPLLLVVMAVVLMFTPIWSDTFGPAPGKRVTGRTRITTVDLRESATPGGR